VLRAKGWGEMTTRSEVPPRRHPWAFDNGAFGDWRAGRPFDTEGYQRALDRLGPTPPAFLMVPDIVAGGLASLTFSLSWADRLRGIAPLYLAVQDGMMDADVAPVASTFAGLFVGGSLPWKIATGASWVTAAHAWDMPCHIGRVGAYRRVQWARRIGADSIDSCLPLWSAANLERFAAALSDPQMELRENEGGGS
jgi:hypothetical protein